MHIRSGVDLIRISRIEKALDRLGAAFRNRIWTADEQAVAASVSSLAVRFAGKEAIAKALGCGIGRHGVTWLDLEIGRDSQGAPLVALHGAARKIYQEQGGISLSLSLSHEDDLAQAFCVILCE